MGSLTKKIRRNMIEKKYGYKTTIAKLKKAKEEEEEERAARVEQRKQWDSINKRGKE
jgi:hypothetical protein